MAIPEPTCELAPLMPPVIIWAASRSSPDLKARLAGSIVLVRKFYAILRPSSVKYAYFIIGGSTATTD